jgi:predicted DNA-binding protein
MAIAKKTVVGVRLGPRMKQRADKRARLQGTTLSDYIRNLIDDDLKKAVEEAKQKESGKE